MTVTGSEATFPSTLAETAAVPGATAVIVPAEFTVTTPASLEDQATARPVSEPPAASVATTVTVRSWPTCIVAAEMLSWIPATGTGPGGLGGAVGPSPPHASAATTET